MLRLIPVSCHYNFASAEKRHISNVHIKYVRSLESNFPKISVELWFRHFVWTEN
jgi:hypothetical protein